MGFEEGAGVNLASRRPVCLEARRPSLRRRMIRAGRMAVILSMLAGAGLAAGAAWGAGAERNDLVVKEPRPIVHVPAFPPEAEDIAFVYGVYQWPIVKVIDGDTIKVDARGDFPPALATLNVRLRGVDTPEKGGRAKCDAERRAGRAATAFTAAAQSETRTDGWTITGRGRCRAPAPR